MESPRCTSSTTLVLSPTGSNSPCNSFSTGEVEAESINKDATLYEWENKIAEETTLSPSERKVSFSGESFPSKINLYSENVIHENDTTEEVDRKPIADIASTKKHWETLFQEKNSQKKEDVKPKGTVRHWDVKIHKYEKHSVNAENNNNNNNDDDMADSEMYENESAIEREIRLALEREEMLKREKAAALAGTNVETNGNNENVVVAERDAPVHSSYEEMTEVDRAAEMLRRRVMVDLEPLPPSPSHDYVNLEDRRLSSTSSQDSENRNGVFLNESIVEREIRETTEREEERRRERAGDRTTSRGSVSDKPDINVNTSAEDKTDGMDRIRERASPELSYEKAVSQPDHSGESLIARELRETREREEELRKMRQQVYAKPTNTASEENNTPTAASPKSQQNGHNGTVTDTNGRPSSWQKEVSPYVSSHKRNSSVDSISSSHSSNRGGSAGSLENAPLREKSVKVQPVVRELSIEDSKTYEPCSETPIEREIRLAREREDDFRRAKGLPVADRKAEQPQIVEAPVTTNYSRPGHLPTESSTLKRLTNNRLKQEIRKEMLREETLRKEGKISTTSDERMGQPMKYVEVKDQTDGAPKRNFLIKKREVTSPRAETPNNNGSVTPTTPHTPVTPSSNTPKRSLGGSTTFSYKETRQKAESKIEQELREMREREEELKRQRADALSQSPQVESSR